MTKNSPQDLVFVAAKRTPFGALGGALSKLSANDLALSASRACLVQLQEQNPDFKASDLQNIIFGNVVQSSSDAIYLPRHVGLKLGVPKNVPALGVNRLCGSGFEAIVQGAYSLRMEASEFCLVGGAENMSQIPYVLRSARFGYRMGSSELEDYLTASLTDSYVNLPMALTAEKLAEKHSITRQHVDEFALSSQQRHAAAVEKNIFKDEMAPVEITSKKGSEFFSKDEHARPQTTLADLQKLKAIFKKDGVVTAGNASGICDGACALIMTTREKAEKRGLQVLGTLKAWASVGCEPSEMGIGPVPATLKAIERYSQQYGHTLKISDFKQVEVNEAFAAQYLAVEKELGLDRDKTNIHGGAIALGHPLAASGARLITHLLYSLASGGGGLGLGAACIGGGQGTALIISS